MTDVPINHPLEEFKETIKRIIIEGFDTAIMPNQAAKLVANRALVEALVAITHDTLNALIQDGSREDAYFFAFKSLGRAEVKIREAKTRLHGLMKHEEKLRNTAKTKENGRISPKYYPKRP